MKKKDHPFDEVGVLMHRFSTAACLLLICGCAYAPHKPSAAVANIQLEEELEALEIEIESMQEEVNLWKRGLQKQGDAMAGVMGPAGQERLRLARESAYIGDQYANDLRASKPILSRKLKALMAESKVYHDYAPTNVAPKSPEATWLGSSGEGPSVDSVQKRP